MKIFMTGGTGFVGGYFTKRFLEEGHHVTILTRSDRPKAGAPSGQAQVTGDPGKPGPWQEAIAGHDAVVNLAGASIFRPWTSIVRKSILESRILTTRHVVEAIQGAPGGISLLSASAVGYYGGRLDDEILAEDAPPGDDFLAQVGAAWEGEALKAAESGTRVVLCRFGIILGRGGGALERMVPPFKKYMGSHLGSGKQWFPWIHEEDLFRIFHFLLEKKHIEGPVNCTAPNPVTSKEFAKALAKALGKAVLMPGVPALAIRLAMGDFADVILKGQRVIPGKLLDEGFNFKFPHVQEALRDLLPSF